MNYKNDVEALDDLHARYRELHTEISKVIYGQDQVVTQVLNTLFSRGHCLLIGVPGLAKTLLVISIAKVLGLKYNRIQFTPDLMPSDIIGTEILDKDRQFRFVPGPVFANIILADEINRTPPKTQSALLEAMQEQAVTSAGHHFILEQPFLCWPPRILSSRKARIRFLKPSSTVLCFPYGSTIRSSPMKLPL